MAEKDKVLDKIKKLLKLQKSAEDLGNEGEAYAAANAVHRLLTAYNLSLSDITENKESELDIELSEYISYRNQYGNQWKRQLLTVICLYNYCRCLINPSCQKMVIVGQVENVVIVKNLYDYLVEAFKRLSLKRMNEFNDLLLQQGKQLSMTGKKNFLSSYYIGAVFGLQDNLKENEPSTTEKGLMVCHETAIENFLQAHEFYNKRSFKGRKHKSHMIKEGITVGLNDGRNISLSKQINKNNNNTI